MKAASVSGDRGARAGEQHPVRHILIVDDDRSVLFTLERSLRTLGSGFLVTSAYDGHDALRQVLHKHFDLIITDIRMPGIDGIALTEAIRLRRHNAPVVWITGCGCQSLQADQQRLAVCICLEKPIEIEEFRNAVHCALAT